MQGQGVVAGDRREIVRFVVAQRAYAGIAVQDVVLGQLALEVGVDHVQQVVGFLRADLHVVRIALVFAVGGADQGKALEIGQGEDHAAVFVLQHVGVFAVVQARHDQVAALDQADTARRAQPQFLADEARHPWAGGVHQDAGADRVEAAVAALEMQVPEPLALPGADAAGASVDVRAVFTGAHGIQDYQTGVVHRAVGVLETAADLGLERAAGAKPYAARGWQPFPPAQMVIKEQPGADQPGRAQMRAVRQDEAQRADDMRRLAQQDLTLGEGLAHQAEFAVFQIAQAAVDQLAAGGGGMAGKVVLFAKEHGQPAPGSIRRDADAIDATADHGDVVDLGEGAGMLADAHSNGPL
ncbi:hypothetical protein D3C76_673250 [compost metagenome]